MLTECSVNATDQSYPGLFNSRATTKVLQCPDLLDVQK